MKLGVYRVLTPAEGDEESPTLEQIGLLDVEAGEWVDGSTELVVKNTSENPTPEEVYCRFGVERKQYRVLPQTHTLVQSSDVVVKEETQTPAEILSTRNNRIYPYITHAERQYVQENHGKQVSTTETLPEGLDPEKYMSREEVLSLNIFEELYDREEILSEE